MAKTVCPICKNYAWESLALAQNTPHHPNCPIAPPSGKTGLFTSMVDYANDHTLRSASDTTIEFAVIEARAWINNKVMKSISDGGHYAVVVGLPVIREDGVTISAVVLRNQTDRAEVDDLVSVVAIDADPRVSTDLEMTQIRGTIYGVEHTYIFVSHVLSETQRVGAYQRIK